MGTTPELLIAISTLDQTYTEMLVSGQRIDK